MPNISNINLKNLIHILKIFLTVVIVSIVVTFTYFVFESAVRISIDEVWYGLFNIEENRFVIIPVLTGITLLFFWFNKLLGTQNILGSRSGGLAGSISKYSLITYIKILAVGFLSLFAGASLGPEAILVPASLTIAHVIGKKTLSNNSNDKNLITVAAIVALFASFLHSFIAGLLTVVIFKKLINAQLNIKIFIIALFASFTAVQTLGIIEPKKSFFSFPDSKFSIQYEDIFIALILLLAGYLITYLIKYSISFFKVIHDDMDKQNWVFKAIFASLGLSLLYFIAGPLVMFTGNESIQPLLNEANNLGVVSILAIGFIKILSISWSRCFGYFGGLIFPTIFVASCAVSVAYVIFPDLNYMFALIATFIGVLLAERKAKILV